MTQPDRVEAAIAEWLGMAGARRAPHGTLDAVLDRTRAMRPLPAWRAMVAVPSMRRESAVLVGSPIARRTVLAGAILMVALMAALLVAGAMLLRARLSETQLFLYVANPVSLPAGFCAEGRDCRNALSGWPGGRFLLSQQLGASEPEVLVEAPWPSTIVEFRLSPSGTRLAYVRTQRNFPASCVQLLVLDLKTGDERLVGETILDPKWAIDAAATNADRLLFATGGRCSADFAGVFEFDAETGSIDQLLDFDSVFGPTTGSRFGSEPVEVHALHPDGRHLLVSVFGPNRGQIETLIVPIIDDAGGPSAGVTCDCTVVGGSWSPDGTRLLLDAGHGPLWLARGDGSEARELASLADSPSWSPDSTSISYLGPVLDAGSGRNDRAIVVVAAAGGEPSQIAGARLGYPSLGTAPQWSPDGDRIYWSDVEGTWAIRPDGTDLRRIALPAQIDLRWVTVEGR